MIAPRHNVLWFGATPGTLLTQEIENRQGALRAGDPATVPTAVRDARTTMVTFDHANEADMIAFVGREARRLIDYGLRVDLIAADDAAAGRIQTGLGAIVGLPGVHVHTAPAPAAMAEAIARHDAGAAPRLDLIINVPNQREGLRHADHPLFQRAFAHCSAITLVELGGGRSDARVFAVHMTVDRSKIGSWPQPAFVKLDRRDKIAVEHGNYSTYAERFIPFGLRPNIETMVVGSERSLLVGNFVDRSESLWDLARRNVAARAITALLEETLGGWRDQGYAHDPQRGSVAVAMRELGLWSPDRIDPYYIERASDENITTTPAQLWDTLKVLDQSYRSAPIHGDLHGDNVRVRGDSAILIDLASVCIGPLTADLAALETWLAFELPPENDKQVFKDAEWEAVAGRLYQPQAFRHAPGPCRPATRYAWIETVVRQIRKLGIAIQSCPGEYQTAVAVQLLRRCQWSDGPPGDRGRRAKGYALAVTLVDDLKACVA